MRILLVQIRNFRKLKDCRIDLGEKTTLFVGANNSGKTSAMDAIAKFLGNRKFVFNDIIISNKIDINLIGENWIREGFDTSELSIRQWNEIVPSLNVWLGVESNQLQYVSHLIPTLDWDGGKLGIRLLYQPQDVEKLYKGYIESYSEARETENKSKDNKILLWPQNLCDYLEKNNNLSIHFGLDTYLLDPTKMNEEIVQDTPYNMEWIGSNPLDGLIKIDIISAQRGFSDPEVSSQDIDKIGISSLSTQLRSYYDKHLDPEKAPTLEDLKTLEAMENAKIAFNDTLKSKFKSAISELEGLGYPGVGDPKITLETKVSASQAMQHESAVKYNLASSNLENDFTLPEKYNGLGYQNLISMVFQLIRFRDDWMSIGKIKQRDDRKKIAPIHLVLLEEPEAHLHMQVQQVFIKKAYTVLRNHTLLKEKNDFTTQLVISSHSSAIAKEMEFKNLRYFKRLSLDNTRIIPTSKVINLSDVFGKECETERFITRYLQATHCDLFFADAAILVEGSAESMLLPHFIKNKYPSLNGRYVTVLEISGRHSHKLRPLIEKLCLPTVVITDIDSASPTGHHKATCPNRREKLISSNYAITSWLLEEKSLDKLLDLPEKDKAILFKTPYDFYIRVAYQTPQIINYRGESVEAIASTLEDCLTYTNLSTFEQTEGDGLIGIINDVICTAQDFNTLHNNLYQKLRENDRLKASFALDLIFSIDPETLNVPAYIDEALKWLEKEILNME